MKFESMPKPAETNPYEGLYELPIDALKDKTKELNLDQLSWLSSKLDIEKGKIDQDMADPAFKSYERSAESDGPRLVNGRSLEELTQQSSELELKANIVSEAMTDPRFKNYDRTE